MVDVAVLVTLVVGLVLSQPLKLPSTNSTNSTVMGVPSTAVVNWLNMKTTDSEKEKFGSVYNNVMEHTRAMGAVFDHSNQSMVRTINCNMN